MGLYNDSKEIVKDLISIAKTIDNMELKDKILDMQNTFYELTDENRELRLENEQLKNNNILSGQVEFKGYGYYLKDDGPFCTRCWDAEQKLIRIAKTSGPFRRLGEYKCPNCDSTF